ncbi:MAG: acetylpolyamine amidohydrolase [Planctomycetes bacterium]|nr:acetylpolyamine amidohydrolase [Planctomycetota bacterium]
MVFRLRRVHDAVIPVDRDAVEQVQAILRAQFSGVPEDEVAGVPARLQGLAPGRFRTILLVAERFVGGRPAVEGFSLVSHDPQVGFCFLDFIATARGLTSQGIGGALYEHVRDEARALGAKGLFFECLPDELPAEHPMVNGAKPDRSPLVRADRRGNGGAPPATASTTPQPGDGGAPRSGEPRALAGEAGGAAVAATSLAAAPAAAAEARQAAPTREELLRTNAARLRFYEHWGARPIIGTLYQLPTPTSAPGAMMPLLVYDPLTGERPLRRDVARQVVRSVLEGKYAKICPPEYVRQVLESIKDDPVRLRPARYVRRSTASLPRFRAGPRDLIPLVVNDRHGIHHVREQGYVEAPVRIKSIMAELEPTGAFERIEPREWSDRHIKAVHDPALVEYLRRACAEVPEGESVYPYVFPIRNPGRPPRDLSYRAGYFCIDTFTPINRNAFPAARRAVACALTAARLVLEGRRVAYALVRPPGHHAERRVFGGFCYFNNAAVAAQLLSEHGPVAILDVDYHHGNGQQEIFWERQDVLTISLHGHPRFAYPFFTGFEDERGGGPGVGFNLNLPLPESQDGAQYRKALGRALVEVRRFKPMFLVVCLGLDTAKRDPTGTWTLGARDFELNGQLIGELGLPTLVVQEGGYRTRTLGTNARHFFQGLRAGAQMR